MAQSVTGARPSDQVAEGGAGELTPRAGLCDIPAPAPRGVSRLAAASRGSRPKNLWADAQPLLRRDGREDSEMSKTSFHSKTTYMIDGRESALEGRDHLALRRQPSTLEITLMPPGHRTLGDHGGT